MKQTFAILTSLGLCATAQTHAAFMISNAETLPFTGGTFTAGTSTTEQWYGGGDGSKATGGNPAQFMSGAAFEATSLAFVTLPAPVTSEEWKLTYDFIGEQNWSGNNRIYLIGLETGASLTNEASLIGDGDFNNPQPAAGISIISGSALGDVASWTSYAPAAFTIPAGLSAVAIGITGNNAPAVFGLDNLHVIPEPSSMALLGLGAAGLLVRRRRI